MLPNEPVARARIEELYRAEGRWVELAASLEERTDPRLGTAAPEAERPLLLRELAQMYVEKLQRPHDAIDAFERLRMLAPADTTVLFPARGSLRLGRAVVEGDRDARPGSARSPRAAPRRAMRCAGSRRST